MLKLLITRVLSR